MNGREISTLALTFVVGIFFGFYVYFSGFLSLFDTSGVQTQTGVNSLSITAEVYGGCRSACPSFQIASDGSYRYLFTPEAGADQVLRDGDLPSKLKRDIRRFATIESLEDQSREIQPAICNSYSDGIDARYRIILDGELYVIDTCGTSINTDSWLWLTLVDIWSYLETGS